MNDLISRDALFKDMHSFKKSVILNKNPAQRRLPNWNDAVSLVGSAPVVNRWISVEDRLPKKDDYRTVTRIGMALYYGLTV